MAGTISLTSLGTAFTENFNTLASTGTSSALPNGIYFNETLGNANAAYTAGTGSATTGDTYSFGSSGAADRALGTIQTGSLISTIGASFTNNTGATIGSLLVAFTGEQWRFGATGRADRLDFQYSLDAASLTTGTWTDVDALDVSSPNTGAAVGPLDGNAAGNRSALSSTIAGLSVANGGTVWFRWLDFNAAGSDDGLAIDDLSVTAQAPPAGATLRIAATDATRLEGDSGTTPFTFTVTRAGDTTGAIDVTYTVNGSGTNPADATDFGGAFPTGTVSFAAGETTKVVTVNVSGDSAAEPDETFTVALSAATGGATITTASATGTILTNEIPGGTATATFTISSPGTYTLPAGTTRTQSAGVGISVASTTGPVNLAIDGTLNDTASGSRAIDVANNPIAGTITVGADGRVQSLNADAIRNQSQRGQIDLTNFGQIVSDSNVAVTANGTNPGTGFAITYNAVLGATGAGAGDYTSGGTITNGSTANTAALIQSNNGDAIRMGSHSTLVNYGVILANGPVDDSNNNNGFNANSNDDGAAIYDTSRGVRFNQNNGTAGKIENYGRIEGAQHAVDVGQTNITNIVVNNYANAIILGQNGSGVGADVTGAAVDNVVVNNFGTIRGEYAPSFDRVGFATTDGDGDGVDVDGSATVNNHAGATIAGSGAGGNLTGTGAGGFDSGGRANASEGLSLGGGVVVNDGLISGANAAIVINNDSVASRSGVAATAITNGATGTIIGQASYAIRFENKAGTAIDNDTIVNAGTITGNGTVPNGTVNRQDGNADPNAVGTLDGVTYTGADAGNARFIRGDGSAIQTGEGTDALTNYGTITGNSGRAVNMEGGADTLTLFTGSTVVGRLDGGAGTDTLFLRADDRPAVANAGLGSLGANSTVLTGSLANVVNFEALAVASGTWSLTDAQGYTGGATVEAGATLALAGAGDLTGTVTDNGRLVLNRADDFTLAATVGGTGVLEKAGAGTATLANAGNAYSGGTVLTAGTLDVAAAGAAGTGAITFGAGAVQTLRVEAAALVNGSFGNAIAGLENGDAIDVRGIGAATTATLSAANVLTLSGGSQSAALQLDPGQNFAGKGFALTDDGAGGTLVTLTDAPSLSIADVTVTEGDSGTTNATFTVTRTGGAGALAVAFATSAGTATAGADYTTTTGTLTFAAGQNTATIVVPIVGDTASEAAESFTVTLSDPTNGAVLSRAAATGTITDNDTVLPGTISLTAAGSAYTQNFNTLASTATSSTLPNGFYLSEAGANANATYTAGTGSGTSGDTYSFGSAGSAERAFGGLQSGSLIPTIGASFTNGTGGTIGSLAIAYTGEQWRLGATGRADRLDFQYSLDATSLTTGTWLDVNALDFSSPVTAGTTGALDGNAAANRAGISSSIDGLSLANGATIWTRWVDLNASGADDGLAIDDLSVTASAAVPPVGARLSIGAVDASKAEGAAGATTAFTFTVTRGNDTSGATDVTYTVAGTGASPASAADFVGGAFPTGTVSFAAGETSKTVTVNVLGDDATEPNETFSVTLSNATGGATIGTASATGTIVNDDVALTHIFTIQGAGHISAFNGQTVTTRGVVTGLFSNGFTIQDALGDGDVNTSDGVFVFTNAAPTVTVGREVQVSGTVTEFKGTGRTNDLSLTEITSPTVTDLGAAAQSPVSTVLGDGTGGTRKPPLVSLGDDDVTGTYDPATQGTDFYESLEGMLVTIRDAVATGPFRSSFNEITVRYEVGANPSVNGAGGLTISDTTPGTVQPADKVFDFNPERLQIDDRVSGGSTPVLTATGDRLGDITGVISYEFGAFDLNTLAPVTVVTPSTLQRETSTLSADLDGLRVATFNVENLAPVGQPVDGSATTQAKYNGLADAIINNLRAPEIIALQEVLDNDGETNSAVVSASATLANLVDAIVARGGPRYVAIDSPPVDDTVGGIPGGNQRVAYLFLADAVAPSLRMNLQPVVSDGSGVKVYEAATSTQIGQGNTDFTATRKSLPMEWTPAGYTDAQGGSFWTVNNHLSSKGGSAPLAGSLLELPLYADPLNGSAQTAAGTTQNEREGQAELVNAYVDGILANGSATDDRVIALGDFNDFQFFPVIDLITGGLVRTEANPDGTPSVFAAGTAVMGKLAEKLPVAERYSYNFDGNSQALDQILVTNGLYGSTQFDIVHINSDFATQLSDHDPSIAALAFSRSAAIATSGNDTFDGAAYTAKFGATRGSLAGNDTMFGLAGDDRFTPGAGNDTVDGGDGTDTIAFTGNRADYTVTATAGGFVVTDNRAGGDGADTVSSVESFAFADRTISAAGLTDSAGPTFTSTAQFGAAENQRSVGTVQASDASGPVAYAIVGGADAGRFTIDAGTGVLAFADAPDFEAPADAGGNNVYDVTVRATDTVGNGSDQAITVTVTDVNEGATTYTRFDVNGAPAIWWGDETNTSTTVASPTTAIVTHGDGTRTLYTGTGLAVAGGTFSGTITSAAHQSGDGTVTFEEITGFSRGASDVLGTASPEANALGIILSGNDVLNGGTGVDILVGFAGDDLLNGGAGADTMRGGLGNDSYSVLDAGDVTIENAGEGIDTVTSLVSYTLSANLENLALGGSGNIAGGGNELFNLIVGNGGNNVIDGGAGNDTMQGGAGDDTYVVDSLFDSVVEAANGGADTVNSFVAYTLGSDVENLTLFGSANVAGGGNALANQIIGNAGNNVLDGGLGADTMFGGAGDDVYVVDEAGDVAAEGAAAGTDTVNSFVSMSLGAEIENLTLFGSANLVGGGNGLNNQIIGNSGNNVLDGAAGVDTMFGGLGDDIYQVDSLGDVAAEGLNAGTDTVNSFVSLSLGDNIENLTLFGVSDLVGGGNAFANVVIGNGGANTLDGRAGADTMIGGQGNDTYVVDDAGDVVAESAGEGTDTVNSYISLTLGATVENLTLLGTGNLVGGGNALANVLLGNAGSNVLDGFAGADTMIGGQGDDTFVVDDGGDIVAEGAGEGTDTVNSYVSFSLGGNIENLTLLGANAASASGNGIGNRIIGNEAANTIDGLGGQDSLFGGAGDDIFVFRRGQSNGDTIGDFVGNGPGAGDSLLFVGFGTAAQGATFTQLDVTNWSINSADGLVQELVTFSNGAAINPADYLFV